jgi:hypothetical protein
MCEHRLRNCSAGATGHGTALGAVGYFCAGARLVQHVNTLPRKNRGGENIERSVFNLEDVTAKKCDKEGKSVVKDYVSTVRTYTTRTRATWCLGTEMNFRVTVAAHESNCKITS